MESCKNFLQYFVLDRCPKLTKLKIRRHRFPDNQDDSKVFTNSGDDPVDYRHLDPFVNFDILNTIASFNSKSLQKVHLYSPNIGTVYLKDCTSQTMKKFLENITENMPKIQHVLMNPCIVGWILTLRGRKFIKKLKLKRKSRLLIVLLITPPILYFLQYELQFFRLKPCWCFWNNTLKYFFFFSKILGMN